MFIWQKIDYLAIPLGFNHRFFSPDDGVKYGSILIDIAINPFREWMDTTITLTNGDILPDWLLL